MNIRGLRPCALLIALLAGGCGLAVGGAAPVPEARFVIVDPGVRLEVLDWGGTGRPVVLLTGSGHTAHIFDEFAPTLRDCCHVYAVTRRGYGASSRPDAGYDDQRLADDVMAVIDGLRLTAPVLIGHSMGGGELTTVASQHSDRLGGLVYLDALADPVDATFNDPAFMALSERLPAAMRTAPPADYSSFAAYRAAQQRDGGFAFPESELRASFSTRPDGRMAGYTASTDAIHRAIGAGQKKRDYTRIAVPVLAISTFTCTRDAGGTDVCIEHDTDRARYQPATLEEAAAIRAYEAAQDVFFDRWKKNLRNARATVRLVDIPRGAHHIFLSHQTDVVREVHAFIAGLR